MLWGTPFGMIISANEYTKLETDAHLEMGAVTPTTVGSSRLQYEDTLQTTIAVKRSHIPYKRSRQWLIGKAAVPDLGGQIQAPRDPLNVMPCERDAVSTQSTVTLNLWT